MSQYIPETLAQGRYQVGQTVGHGGMAEVYLGTDTRLGRQVAIKIMRSDLANDQVFLARFRREAHSVAQLNNPNIVSIYDTGEETFTVPSGSTEKAPYIIMEYVKGQTLRDIIKENGALSQRDSEQIIIGVLNALEYSHRMGIIHRDIKPGNIMISDQGVVKVMDFGIARALDDSATTMTQSQGVVGTAQYLSPEQARGETVDMRSDLYSAGCVLYEMLTGRPPFTGDSPVAIAYQHVSQIATPPSVLVPGLPKIWDSIIAKAMAKDRQNRYSTAIEFKRDITAVMNGGHISAEGYNPLTDINRKKSGSETMTMPQTSATMPVTAISPSSSAPISVPAASTATSTNISAYPATTALADEVEPKKHHRAGWIIIAIIALIVLAGGGWYFINQTSTATIPTITAGMSAAQAKTAITNAGFTFQEQSDGNTDKPKGTFIKQNPAGGTSAAKGTTVTVWFSSGPASSVIPDVAGMTESEAEQSLQASGFTVSSVNVENSSTVARNHVTRTDPVAGSSESEGSSVILYISSGQMTMPSVTGKSQSDAQAELQKSGFSITIQQQSSSTVAKGNVISTNPAAGTTVSQGSMVTMIVSSGPQQTNVPGGLSGQSIATVRSALEALGLKVTVNPSNAQDNWIVNSIIGQNNTNLTSNGGSVTAGSTVTLTAQQPSSSSNQSTTNSNSSSSSQSSNSSSNSSSTGSNSSNNSSTQQN